MSLSSSSSLTSKGTKNIKQTSTPTAHRAAKRKLRFNNKPYSLRKKVVLKEAQADIEREEQQKQKEYEKLLNKSIRNKSLQDYYEQYHTLPLKYIKKFLKDPNSKKSDGKFRVKFDKSIEQFSIGNKRIDFDGPDIIVAGKKFKGTKGLYGLLFNQHIPSDYTSEDGKNFKTILSKANVIKPKTTSKNTKFKKIIEPYMNQAFDQYDSVSDNNDGDDENKFEGRGLPMQVTKKPIDYIYWNDPNELVNRLKLLIASQNAGNTGQNNEINAIIEELYEANIIQ